jgi:hypothetical protein
LAKETLSFIVGCGEVEVEVGHPEDGVDEADVLDAAEPCGV